MSDHGGGLLAERADLMRMGRSLFSQESPDNQALAEAEEAMDGAIDISPSADAFCIRAQVRIKLGKIQEAASDAGAAFEMTPSCPECMFTQAEVWVAQARSESDDERRGKLLDKALELYEQASEVDSTAEHYRQGLIRCCQARYEQGAYGELELSVERADEGMELDCSHGDCEDLTNLSKGEDAPNPPPALHKFLEQLVAKADYYGSDDRETAGARPNTAQTDDSMDDGDLVDICIGDSDTSALNMSGLDVSIGEGRVEGAYDEAVVLDGEDEDGVIPLIDDSNCGDGMNPRPMSARVGPAEMMMMEDEPEPLSSRQISKAGPPSGRPKPKAPSAPKVSPPRTSDNGSHNSGALLDGQLPGAVRPKPPSQGHPTAPPRTAPSGVNPRRRAYHNSTSTIVPPQGPPSAVQPKTPSKSPRVKQEAIKRAIMMSPYAQPQSASATKHSPRSKLRAQRNQKKKMHSTRGPPKTNREHSPPPASLMQETHTLLTARAVEARAIAQQKARELAAAALAITSNSNTMKMNLAKKVPRDPSAAKLLSQGVAEAEEVMNALSLRDSLNVQLKKTMRVLEKQGSGRKGMDASDEAAPPRQTGVSPFTPQKVTEHNNCMEFRDFY